MIKWTIVGIILLLLSNTMFVDRLVDCYSEPTRFCIMVKVG